MAKQQKHIEDQPDTSPILLKFGQKVHHFRTVNEVSLKMLSCTTGISSKDLVLIEQGQRDVMLDELSIIAIGLGIDMQELLG